MAKSGDFEVADSSDRFRGIGHFLENRSFLSTLCTLKIRGIGHISEELARRIRHFKIATFSRLSSIYLQLSLNKSCFWKVGRPSQE